MKCQYCQGFCAKKGCYKKRQLYRCKECLKYQRSIYLKHRIRVDKMDEVKRLSNEGNSVSTISRLVSISKSSVQRVMELLKKKAKRPVYHERGEEYEMDELYTYCKNKKAECWIMYAINKRTKSVIDFVVGRRTKNNIRRVVDSLMMLHPKRVFTDRLNIYPGLIPKEIHVASSYKINHIERKNLDLRKDTKCLNRSTICYSKSEQMLMIRLWIYFWG